MTQVLTLLQRLFSRNKPLHHELILAAGRAPDCLGESTELVLKFLLSKQNADGGFMDRDGNSDLYYTVFGMQSLLALNHPVSNESIRSYLHRFGNGDGLDFVHLCCLARCRGLLGDIEVGDSLAHRIETHRANDGGYHSVPCSAQGTVYAAFLAMGAYQDLSIPLPNPSRLANAIRSLVTPDGGWANQRPAMIAATNSTAAAIAVLGSLQPLKLSRKPGHWLLAQTHPLGGFRASPLTPLPDLLSTATALHSLSALGFSLEPLREPCLDFIDTLWCNEGGFYGHFHDDFLDVEYTFYGLLALGLLAK